MTGATSFLQLSTTSAGELEAPRALPLVAPLPHVLSFTRYAHGEIKLSIYPQPAPKRGKLNTLCETTVRDVMRQRYEPDKYWAVRRAPHARSLVQSLEFQEGAKEMSGYGGLPKRKTFRRYGRQVIKECGAVAWRKFGQSGIFLTGTVPGSGAVIAETVARYSGWLLNRVKQWFRDSFSEDYAVFAVWELQERGMLHIHCCVLSMEKDILSQFKREWKSRWNGLLLELTKATGVDLFRKNEHWTWQDDLDKTRQDAQWLVQDPSRYLAKYLTKDKRKACSEYEFHPSAWWSVDRKTAALARKERLRVILGGLSLQDMTSFVEEWFQNFGEGFENVFSKVYHFTNPTWQGCGGVVMFTEPETSLAVAAFYRASVEYFLGSELE